MRKRNVKKNFWFTREEDNILKNKTSKAGLDNESELVRLLVLGYEPREKPDDRFYDVMKLMRSMSNSLNQIAKKANSLGFIDTPLYQKEADKWNRFMMEVKKEFLSPKEIK